MIQRPRLSIIVNFHNMRREAQRSLLSLSRKYQLGIENLEYEVIAVDNGSQQPLTPEFVQSFGPEFRHVIFPPGSVSPAAAVNHGVSLARFENVMIMIDGAHILTPRILNYAATLLTLHPNPFIVAIAMPMAPKQTLDSGIYDQAIEDGRIAKTNWPRNGYSLFALPNTFGDDAKGWFGCLFESACVTLRKQTYTSLGGLDEQFRTPGGGLVNLDFFQRVIERGDVHYTVLLGESTFHQFHGGVASNADPARHPWEEFNADYTRIRGQSFGRVIRRPSYFGEFTDESLHIAEISARYGFEWWRQNSPQNSSSSAPPEGFPPGATSVGRD